MGRSLSGHRQAGINWPCRSCIPNTSGWRGIRTRNRRQVAAVQGRQAGPGLGLSMFPYNPARVRLHMERNWGSEVWRSPKSQLPRRRVDSSSSCFQNNASGYSEVTISYHNTVLVWVGRHHSHLDSTSSNGKWQRGGQWLPGCSGPSSV